ncbi:hypothetical protein [Aquibium microcysteis]|uniref:hypothetical protein n=1 Tax=Aquibium microcysteis TaxID=675281 RepID=UPI00165D244E|nr:hypothetical protein [Aquibium microcysteis]
MSPAINGICGVEPNREGEYPHAHAVGFGGVTEIVEELENLGSYGIKWFVVKAGENTLAKMNALHVAHVGYALPAEGGAS